MKELAKDDIYPIGLGTYGIGGRGHRDVQLTEKEDDNNYIDAVAYTINKGINFFEISAGYGHGNALRLVSEGIKASKIQREKLFITNSLYPRDLANMESAMNDLESFYKTLETDYADSTLVTLSMINKFGKFSIYKLLNTLLKQGRTRFVSISNSGVTGLKDFSAEFGEKIFAHENHLSFEVREIQESRIIDKATALGFKNIIWRPLRRNKTSVAKPPLLVELSKKYNKTLNQLILNWMINEGLHPMVMSKNIKHIDENLSAIEFKMSKEDYMLMNNWRPTNHLPSIDWSIDSDSIVELANRESII